MRRDESRVEPAGEERAPRLTEDVVELANLPGLSEMMVDEDTPGYLRRIAEHTRPNIVRDIIVATIAGLLIATILGFFNFSNASDDRVVPSHYPPPAPKIWNL